MTDEQKIQALEELINSQGWQVLVDLIKTNDIPLLTRELRQKLREPNKTIQEIDSIEHRLSIMEETLELPQTIIEKLRKTSTQPPETDPYPRNEVEVKKMLKSQ